MANFTNEQVLKFVEKLSAKWGSSKDSIDKILDNVDSFLEEKSKKVKFLEKVHLFISMLRSHYNGNYLIDNWH